MPECAQTGNPVPAAVCGHRRCAVDMYAGLGGVCGRTADGRLAVNGCGRWFCLLHLHYTLAGEGPEIRLCARCERGRERAESAQMARAMRDARPAGMDPRTIYAVLVAIFLLLPIIATWPSPAGLAVTALLAIIIHLYRP